MDNRTLRLKQIQIAAQQRIEEAQLCLRENQPVGAFEVLEQLRVLIDGMV